ncbi:NADH:flavin oxidoreductase/NADH oxidase [Pseudolabrys taiwanensis]|uniref:NADH:flavin oxidoreductase/NADH oxidase n=1 Tax=Pseudolabrys taiwanensis TaxID=331696 RepID=A0A345ZQR4_9HYPH|nr:NADH:flavin oxidoreductase/NADH oxidase [Pseudolabrys taiwanensis]AXK79261.1 NADH:flavin oxidoreductase/NADH oxidase [Pseudolabrys taiwanensis]
MSDTAAYPLLFTPLKLRGLTARNRIVVSPMSQYAAVNGEPTDWHLVHLGKFAMGGAGIVFVEETSVEEKARKTYSCPGIYTDAQAKAWRRITDFLRNQGALSAIQLGHAGRKVATKAPWDGFSPLSEDDAKAGKAPWRGYAPSPIPFKPGAMVPIEMDHDDIKRVIAAHVDACKRSLDAGFDICEIHGAHGYIIQQFLSPITNHRTDGYGGDRPARMRFCLELIEACREAWPADRPLFFRASCVDGKGGAWTLDDTVALAHELKARGVDMIDCSSGGIEGPLTLAVVPRVPGYHVPFAERIKKDVGIPTMAVGLITEAQQAEGYLAAGQCDLIALAREMMWNPNWPAHAAQTLQAGDPLDLLPQRYSWWLQRREEVRRLYPTGTEAAE